MWKWVNASTKVGVTTTVDQVYRDLNADTRLLQIKTKVYAEPQDFTDVEQFTLTGHVNAIVVDKMDTFSNADLYNVWVPMQIVARPEVVFVKNTVGIPRIIRLQPIKCRIDTGVLKIIGGYPNADGVRLVANTDSISFAEGESLLYDVKFGKSTIDGVEVDFSDMDFTFEAPYADTTVDLATVPRVYS